MATVAVGSVATGRVEWKKFTAGAISISISISIPTFTALLLLPSSLSSTISMAAPVSVACLAPPSALAPVPDAAFSCLLSVASIFCALFNRIMFRHRHLCKKDHFSKLVFGEGPFMTLNSAPFIRVCNVVTSSLYAVLKMRWYPSTSDNSFQPNNSSRNLIK